jgi:hypothetical protein
MAKNTDVALIRKRGEELTNEQVETLVSRMIQEARNYIKDDVENIREENIKYYQAQKFGNEEEGRSKVVMSTLRDAVRGYMPSLLRLFFGSDTVVEFTPHGSEDEPLAKQQTDYVNHIFRSDNPGFLITHALLKDAMYQKIGIATWDWDETTRVERMQFTGLSEEQYEILLADDDTEVDIDSTIDSEFGKMYNVTVEHTTHGRCRVMACPPEEVAWNRNARDKDDARIIVHSREVPMSDLVSAGHSWDDVEEAAGFTEGDNLADDARRVDKGANRISEDAQDPHTRPVLYHNAYVLLDVKGKSKPSIWRVEMIGDNSPKFLKKTPVSHAPFAFFCFDPEPHTIIGLDVADYTKDLQKIDSAIVRGTLDSLTNTLEPVEEVVENMVNLDDLINRELGKIVRVKQPGMMREVEHRFVGRDSLPMLEYTEGVRENRLGISKASAGLDADALQSSTKQAVAGTLRKGQEQIELVARILAETGMKQMFKGILRTVIENQDRKRVVRLNNQYVEVDPRSWDASRDVRVNVALGAGLAEERLRVLGALAHLGRGERRSVLEAHLGGAGSGMDKADVAAAAEVGPSDAGPRGGGES